MHFRNLKLIGLIYVHGLTIADCYQQWKWLIPSLLSQITLSFNENIGAAKAYYALKWWF